MHHLTEYGALLWIRRHWPQTLLGWLFFLLAGAALLLANSDVNEKIFQNKTLRVIAKGAFYLACAVFIYASVIADTDNRN